MKRVFPLIIVLITLSLVGIIALQFSWFKNMLELKKEQLLERVDKALSDVSRQIAYKEKLSSTYPKDEFDKLLRSGMSMFGLYKPPSIVQRFNTSELNEKIQKALQEHDLKNLKYEFAIINNTHLITLEVQTGAFNKVSNDTINNKIRVVPIEPIASEWEGLASTEQIVFVIPNFTRQVYTSLFWMICMAILFTVIIIAAFFLTVRTMLRQKKISEIKTDFINNMTHEFKTPLATISLAIDALRNEKVLQNKEQLQYFGNIIKEENKRMNNHVEAILQAALLEKGELEFNLKPHHAHVLIQRALDNFDLQLQQKKAIVNVHFSAKNDWIEADEVHMINVINNIIDNAIKYSKKQLTFNIETKNVGKQFVIRMEDNGIGMSRETIKRIFEKFYRAHTGNLHDVKGFGLGMNYVKTIVQAHKGHIKVESLLDKGSTFIIEIPIALNHT